MTRITNKKIQPCASAEQSEDSAASHYEIEVKVGIKNKQEAQKIESWLYGQGYAFEKKTRIVDFLEPSRSVTSRVRFEKPLGRKKAATECYIGKKCHPIAGELEDFVRQESDPSISATVAVETLMRAIEAHKGKPIPYYTKKRRYFSGMVGNHPASIALDKPEGLSKEFIGRFMEVEIQLPLTSPLEDVAAVVNAINCFIERVLGEVRIPEISYRKMVMKTWRERGML